MMSEQHVTPGLARTGPSPVEIRDALNKFESRLADRTKVPPNKLSEFM